MLPGLPKGRAAGQGGEVSVLGGLLLWAKAQAGRKDMEPEL